MNNLKHENQIKERERERETKYLKIKTLKPRYIEKQAKLTHDMN